VLDRSVLGISWWDRIDPESASENNDDEDDEDDEDEDEEMDWMSRSASSHANISTTLDGLLPLSRSERLLCNAV